MRRIAIVLVACAAAACVNDSGVTYTLSFQVARASTEIRIDGATIDGGGAAPRSLMVSYTYSSWPDAMNVHLLVESFASGSKLGELTVTPKGCAAPSTIETDMIAVSAAGAISNDTSVCTQ